jgi:hypothetical protein
LREEQKNRKILSKLQLLLNIALFMLYSRLVAFAASEIVGPGISVEFSGYGDRNTPGGWWLVTTSHWFWSSSRFFTMLLISNVKVIKKPKP